MPRRPSIKQRGGRSKPRPFDRKDSKLERWEKPSDIPLDEEDEFHTSRDRILLEGDEHGDVYDEGDEDEVFALKGLPEDTDEEEEEAEEDEDENEDDTMDSIPKPSTKKAKKNAKVKAAKGKLGKDSDTSASESEEEEEAWGQKKSAYYSSNAAQLESDDEEANELEEQEAKRLQAKTRDPMQDDDFGLADPVEITADPEEELLAEPAPVVQPLQKDKQSLLRHLEKNNPEALALARDWDDTARSLMKAQAEMETLEGEDADDMTLGLVHLHHQALLTYATTLAFYLHLRASEKYAQKPDLLRDHPIISRLLTLKQSLATLEDLTVGLSDSDLGSDEDEEDEGTMDENDFMADAQMLWSSGKKKGLEINELADLLKEAEEIVAARGALKGKKHKADESKPSSGERPKKKRKTTKDAKPQVIFDVAEPDLSSFSSTSKSGASRPAEDPSTDLFGEAMSLHAVDAADKQARKRSLRFHTSKIESTSARRQGARKAAMGGDDDIPYRERKREREERIRREGENSRSKGRGGEDLDDAEPEQRAEESAKSKKKRVRDEEDDESDEGGAGGYYDLVQRRSKEKKEEKKAEYEALRAASRPDFEEDTTDGPRSLTRAILKNKGLTPRRGKSVRNPRVKKREKFEKAKKKLASQKAVYKGGLAESGRYEGEKSGISRVVKSVRL